MLIEDKSPINNNNDTDNDNNKPPSPVIICSTRHKCHQAPPEQSSPPTSANPPTTSPPPPPPCKLLTRLAINPTADITQIPTAPSEDEEPDGAGAGDDDGIPCSRAYRMMMQYATPGAKLDAVAQILEEGCEPCAGPGGGCRVKNKTIWKALDDVCI
jgi:hypothetical protein